MGHTEFLLCCWAVGPFFSLDCQNWNGKKASMCASSRSTHPPALQHCDRFRHFPNRTEQHPWMQSIISWHAVQLPCPADIPSHLSMRWTLYSWGPLVRCTQCWLTQCPLRATAPRLCADTAPCAQAGLAVAVLGDMVNVMSLLLLSPRRAPLSEIPLLYCFRIPEDWLVPVPGHPDCCGVWCCGFPYHLSYHLH